MSDLVKRLRKERSVYDAELCDEAADEIERLREALERIANSGIECYRHSAWIADIAREALEKDDE
jgi:hypothetical protein